MVSKDLEVDGLKVVLVNQSLVPQAFHGDEKVGS
jgi:hypothetical protein